MGYNPRTGVLTPNGHHIYEHDAKYVDDLFDDLIEDLSEVLPEQNIASTVIWEQAMKLRDLVKSVLGKQAIVRAAVTVPAGASEDVTVELLDGDVPSLSVDAAQAAAGLARISGGKTGPVSEGRRLIY